MVKRKDTAEELEARAESNCDNLHGSSPQRQEPFLAQLLREQSSSAPS